MMNNSINSGKGSRTFSHNPLFICLAMLSILLFTNNDAAAQTATWTQEVFNASIPYTPAATANRRVTTTDWFQAKISGTAGAPNDFQWVNTGANPVAANQNIAGFPAGAGFVRYVNRNILYGSGTAGVNYAANGDAAYLASRSLDFSGHTTYNNSNGAGAPDTIGLSIFRDGTVGGVASVLDYVQVYINTQPSLTGATLLNYTYINQVAAGPGTTIYRSATQAPVATAGWNRYAFQIPNMAQYVSATGGSSSVYVIVACYSAGGNNIFIDNFNFPQWVTNMAVQDAQLFYQENADVGKGSTQNVLLGVRITTKGSGTALKLDAATFSPNGSTNWLADVVTNGTMSPPYCYAYFTGATANFAITNGAVSMPWIASGPGVSLLNFGWWAAGCGVLTTPATMNLNPGSENYVWFAADVKATATSGNFVGADLQAVTVKSGATCTFYGAPGNSSTTFGNVIPQTLNLSRMIDQSYNIPTYTAGTSWAGGSYTNNDFVSAVNFPGDNGTLINNYYHNDSCIAALLVHPIGDPVRALANRYACHPPDYTQFPPQNLGTYKNRFAQVTIGRGVRTGTPPYQLKAMAGTWFGNNCIAVFVDWNKDGDFDDTYNGTGGVISENYGTQCLTQGDMTVPLPAGAWPAGGSWNISVPALADAVTDLNDANQPPNNSMGPIFRGNVRMRVREIYASSNVHPTNSGFTWGEVEDYTIQVLEDCPNPSLNVCKWIGNTSDWSLNSNWCPAVPTINDMAYIPVVGGSFVYPTIKNNTAAVCRDLKIMDNGSGTGAQVVIDAPSGSTLTVADDVIIGSGAPAAGTTANVNVVSNYTNTLTIPGKSSAPPAGLALATVTPFRTNAQQKTQIAYTASELATIYGWKAGDIIDQLSIEVNAISGGAGASTFQNLRIQAYLTSSPVTYPFPAPANVKIAVSAGDPGVVVTWPRVIFGGFGTNQVLNMPMGTLGTQAGGNYYAFNLNANTLVWDGSSNLVLEFCVWTSAGLAPAKAYVLYNEVSPTFNVMALNYATVTAGANNGYNLDGNGHVTTGSLVGVTAVVSNQRPRIDFTWHRPYTKFPITVGGDWINNNKSVRAPSTVAGSDGFRAGWSEVEFNPTIRASVNSPGYGPLWVPNSWNTPASTATLPADVIQNITSSSSPAASTVFNILEINKTSALNNPVQQNSSIASLIGHYADTLWLTNGELYLNRKEFTLQQGVTNALVRTNGWIRSEDNAGGSPGTIDSKFTWKIGAGPVGTYAIPFRNITTGTGVFNLKYVKAAAGDDVGNLSVGTYSTATNNTPLTFPALPVGNPLRVLSMTTNPTPIVDATPWTVDRFWYIKRSSVGALTGGTLTFEYDNAIEGTLTSAYVAGEMKAQRYELTGATPGWHAPYAGQSDLIVAGNIRAVNHPAQYIDATYSIWAITHTNGLQAPLPLSVINFNGKQVDQRVKLWWTVQSEQDVVNYAIERSGDQSFYELVANKTPVGPATATLNYDVYDIKPLSGTSYYRLAASTVDGSTKYYGPVSVNFGKQTMFDITNVQASNGAASIKVDFVYDSNLPYHYMVTDLIGNIVAKGDNNNAVSGENSIVIPVRLSQGIYVISLINNDKTVSRKLVY